MILRTIDKVQFFKTIRFLMCGEYSYDLAPVAEVDNQYI